MARPADITTPTPGSPIESTWGAAVAAASNGVSGGGWYEGIAPAANFTKTFILIRWLTPRLVELWFQMNYTGADIVGSGVGNIPDTQLFSVPAEYLPKKPDATGADMSLGILDCSSAFASCLLTGAGAVTISEINGAGATIGNGDVVRGHAFWGV